MCLYTRTDRRYAIQTAKKRQSHARFEIKTKPNEARCKANGLMEGARRTDHKHSSLDLYRLPFGLFLQEASRKLVLHHFVVSNFENI